MIAIEFPVEIDRPVAEVFAAVTDHERLHEWQPTTIAVTKETPGPLQAGTRLREVRRAPLGRRVESEVEVSVYEPDRRFDLRIVSGPLPVDGFHTFHETPSGTRIDFEARGQARGPLRALEPLLRRVLERQFRGYYARLKELLERGAPQGPPPRGT